MKQLRKILFLTLLISLCSGIAAYGKTEGLSAVTSSTTEQTWMYYTGETDAYLKNQWKQVDAAWYYFGEDGISKHNTWAEIDGKRYYFDQWSKLLHDTTTPDGSYVGADGTVVQNTAAQTTAAETKPVQKDPPAQAETGQTGTVYWTPKGKSYHSSESCSTLKRSKTILSGTLDKAISARKADPCDVCVN